MKTAAQLPAHPRKSAWQFYRDTIKMLSHPKAEITIISNIEFYSLCCCLNPCGERHKASLSQSQNDK